MCHGMTCFAGNTANGRFKRKKKKCERERNTSEKEKQAKGKSEHTGRMSDGEGCVVGVETGGEHMVVAVARPESAVPAIVERWECATTQDPAQTLADVRALVERAAAKYGPLRAVGVASFGPIDPEPASPRYGFITSTPKPGWRDTDVLTALGRGDPRFAHVC